MKSIPHGPENLVCPLHKKAMSKVCHTCPMWISVRGKNPQTGEDIDDWNCALAWSAILSVQTAKEAHMVSCEVNAMRNETKKAHDEHLTMATIAVQRATNAVDETISKYAGQSRQLTDNHGSALPEIENANANS